MKKVILLLLSFIYVTVQGQDNPTSEFDTLSKYSYLLIGMNPDIRLPPGELIIMGNSTGFFVRHDSRLYLVSAFHVFTDCDPYNNVIADVRVRFVGVCYNDTNNKAKQKCLDLVAYKAKKCQWFYEYPDVDIYDVTGAFLDAKINSVESFFEENFKKIKSVDSNKYVCYGFEGNRSQQYLWKNLKSDGPSYGFFATKLDTAEYLPELKKVSVDSLYVLVKPALQPGTSGSPVFKLMFNKRKKKKYLQFAGIQSGSSFNLDFSFIVKPEELSKLVNQLK